MRYLLSMMILMSCISIGAMELKNAEYPPEDLFDERTWDPQNLPCGCKPVLPQINDSGSDYYPFGDGFLPDLPLPIYILYVVSGAFLRPLLPLYEYVYFSQIN